MQVSGGCEGIAVRTANTGRKYMMIKPFILMVRISLGNPGRYGLRVFTYGFSVNRCQPVSTRRVIGLMVSIHRIQMESDYGQSEQRVV